MLFSFIDNAHYNEQYPWVQQSREVDSTGRLMLDTSARNVYHSSEPIEAWRDVTYLVRFNTRRKIIWPDLLGMVGSGAVTVSGRVYEVLKAEGIRRFRADPLLPDPRESGLPSGVEASLYYVVHVAPGIRLDPNVYPSDEHGPRLDKRTSDRPLPETWEGNDLFTSYQGTGFVYCTLRIVELARQHKWTNCRFIPMDAPKKYATGWKGIDYLGKQWPPEQWYPPRPSEGKSLEEWFALYLNAPNDELEYKAARALIDLGEEALPFVGEAFRRSQDTKIRADLADIIEGIRRGNVQVDPELLAQAQSVTAERRAKAQQRYG